jgi:hypothetical protein
VRKTTPVNLHGEGHGVPRAIEHAPDMTRAAGLVAGLLGVLACNPLLGIGEASLRCDPEPCTTDTPLAAGGATDGARDVDAGAARGGAGGVTGAGTLPPAASETNGDPSGAGGSAAPSGGASSGGGGAGGTPAPVGEAGSAEASPSVPASEPEDNPVPDGTEPDDGTRAPEGTGAPGGSEAICSSSGDACGSCLCDQCEDEVDGCAGTAGCFEIVACARLNECVGFACFCGSVDPITCATSGQADGPCVDATLAAPGSRLPTLANPSAGPASDAALELANCTGQRCNACLN